MKRLATMLVLVAALGLVAASTALADVRSPGNATWTGIAPANATWTGIAPANASWTGAPSNTKAWDVRKPSQAKGWGTRTWDVRKSTRSWSDGS